MAAYTSQRTGSWNVASGTASSPWYDGGTQTALNSVPGSGDTATIASPHTVTIPDGYTATIGATGQATGYTALTINSGGKLVIGQGASGVLRTQGDIPVSGTLGLVLTKGASLVFVPSSGQRIKVYGGSQINCNGVSGTRCSVYTDLTALSGGGLAGYFNANTGSYSGLTIAKYTDFTDVDDGATSNGAINVVANTTSAGLNTTSPVTYDNCTFTRCPFVRIVYSGSGFYNASNLTYTNNIHTGTTTPPNDNGQSFCLKIVSGFANVGAQTKTVAHNTFDARIKTDQPYDLDIFDNRFMAGFGLGTGNNSWKSFDNNFIAFDDNASSLGGTGKTFTNNFIWQSNPLIGNSHIVNTNLSGTNACNFPTTTVAGNVFGSLAPDSNGNVLMPNTGDASTAQAIYIRNNIMLANPIGASIGVPMWSPPYVNPITCSIYFEHNTCNIEQQWGTESGHQQTVADSPTNRHASFKGNILYAENLGWRTADRFVKMNAADSGATITDLVSPLTNADYNAGYQLDSGTGLTNSGAGYYMKCSVQAGTDDGMGHAGMGAHDLDVLHPAQANPQFVDRFRCLERWAGDYMIAKGFVTPGAAYKGAWANATAYSVGDIVTASSSVLYNGVSIYYRCTTAHTSDNTATTTNKPNAGNLWTLHTTGSGASANLRINPWNTNATVSVTATALQVQTALQGLLPTKNKAGGTGNYSVSCTGGPLGTADVVVRFQASGVDTDDLRLMFDLNPSLYPAWTISHSMMNWEPYSLAIVRDNPTGTVTDASLGLSGATYNQALLAWVRAGFRPTNPVHAAYVDTTHAFPGDAVTTDPNGNSQVGTIGAMGFRGGTRRLMMMGCGN